MDVPLFGCYKLIASETLVELLLRTKRFVYSSVQALHYKDTTFLAKVASSNHNSNSAVKWYLSRDFYCVGSHFASDFQSSPSFNCSKSAISCR